MGERMATAINKTFHDRNSPWQSCTNENTNGQPW